MLLASEETDPKYLRDMVLSLIAARKDTTASTLTWFIYMLCKHPHIQEKISQEVREAKNLKDNSSIDELSDNLTEEALGKMQYLLAVLNETTRLYPALPLNGKVCFSDDTWPDGFSVKTGDVVAYHAYGMGRMKYIYGVMMQKNFGQRDGLMKMIFSNRKALSNSQPSVRVQGVVLGKDFAYREALIFSAVLWGRYMFKLSDDNKVPCSPSILKGGSMSKPL
ncbi:unnamed protein product [Prunus armeniaca]